MKKFIISLFLILVVAAICFGQTAAAVLATANGFSFTSGDLSENGRKLYAERDQVLARQRSAFLNEWLFSLLLEIEGKAQGIAPEQVRSQTLAKIVPASEEQIKAVYDANRQRLGNAGLEQVRAQIVDYLWHNAESTLIAELETSLKAKHKFVGGKDINAFDLRQSDVVATIGTRTLTAADFTESNKLRLHNFRASLFEQIRSDLEAAIFDRLLIAEAKKRNIDPGSLIAAEITDKMREFTDYERTFLEDALQSRLFEQFNVRFTLSSPEPLVLKVAADDDPSIGPSTAAVTVVAFVDFQCSACASFSPLLKRVVSEFGGSVRLTIRDFPLTSIHKDAMSAALAGYAAREQGKFFEMADLMYGNQNALDRESLRNYARMIGMNIDRFDTDMKSSAAAAEIKKDVEDGNAYGVSGTPTIFVNGVQLNRLSPGGLRTAIRQALK